jgi:hypothetical protein
VPSLKKFALLCATIPLSVLMTACTPRVLPDYTKAHRIADGCSVVIWVQDEGGKAVRHDVWLEPDQWVIAHRSAIK